MKKIFTFVLIVAGVLAAGFAYRNFSSKPNEKVYVAVEGEGKIVAFSPATGKVVSVIELSIEHDGGKLPYAPHNVQVSPDMKSVWVTANAGKHQDHSFLPVPYASAHGDEKEGEEKDEVIVIDQQSEKIIKRIPLGAGLHLAHVVLTPDSSLALVTAQNEGTTYKINAKNFAVEKKILVSRPGLNAMPQEPHGIRVSPDGRTAYVALLKGRGLGVLDLQDDNFSIIPLEGAAVQSGVTPDGKSVFLSLYDAKRLAVWKPSEMTKKVAYISLPTESKGPVQMYATPDSKFVYLADQGYYFGEPPSEWVFKIDLERREVVKKIKAGRGPHGVAISEDGARVYISNLLSGDVSVISTVSDEEISRIKVGKEPNGISVWVKK